MIEWFKANQYTPTNDAQTIWIKQDATGVINHALYADDFSTVSTCQTAMSLHSSLNPYGAQVISSGWESEAFCGRTCAI